MQVENVTCCDLSKVPFERAVGCFGTSQLERATRFRMPQLDECTTRTDKQLLDVCANTKGFVQCRISTRDQVVTRACDSVFEIALVRLSETSDYLLGQVNNPLAVIRRTSGNLQQYYIFHYHFIIMQS